MQHRPGDQGVGLIVALMLAAFAWLVPAGNAAAAYGYFKSFTVDRTKVGNVGAPATFSNYPVLVSVIDLNLKHTSNGGRVTSNTPNGYDIIFRAADQVTQLDHEIEKYDGSTGELVAWVRIPTLNTQTAGSNTVFWIYYGDASVVAPTANPTGVWDANYVAVWHLNETGSGTAGEFKDAKALNNAQGGGGTAAKTPARAAAQIAGGQDFDNTNDYITAPHSASLNLNASVTLSAWINLRTFGSFNDTDTIVGKHDESGTPWVAHYKLALHNVATTGQAALYKDGTDDTELARGTTQLTASTWYYLVATFSANTAGNAGLVYLNGVQNGTGALNTVTFTSTWPVSIGGRVINSPVAGTPADMSDGIIDEVRISNSVRTPDWIKTEYNNQFSPATFYAVGSEQSTVPPVASFNAVEPGANAVTGKIFTKIAGVNFALDIVALDGSNAVLTGFTGAVVVEVVDNTTGAGVCANMTLIATFTNQTFVAGDNGRHVLTSPNAVANSYANAKVRIKYPTSSPTVTACSGDNFAIRPNKFVSSADLVSAYSVTDATTTTAGTTRTLNNVSVPGGLIHSAGRPLTVRATAVNAAGTPATTTNYNGAPTGALTACAGTACTASFGAFALGASFAAGVLTSNAATYADVGSFFLQLVDSTFSNVDLADGSTAAQRNITSDIIAVGRFTPDHFTVSFNTPVFGTACAAGGFTYVGQAFNYTTQPVMTVTAQNFANATTTKYTGAFCQLTSASVTGKAYTAATGTLDTSGTPATDPVVASAGPGIGILAFGSGTGLAFTRTTPVAPFNADISLAINVIDADGVAYATNPARFAAATAGNGIAFSSGKPMRFGRMRVSNALGSELLDLPLTMETQYFTGSGFMRNTIDQCTSIAAANISLGNYQPASFSANVPAGNISISGNFVNGVSPNFKLTKPSPTARGSVDATVNLSPGGANKTYLHGNWSVATYTQNPTGRASFGFYGTAPNNFIYFRENH